MFFNKKKLLELKNTELHERNFELTTAYKEIKMVNKEITDFKDFLLNLDDENKVILAIENNKKTNELVIIRSNLHSECILKYNNLSHVMDYNMKEIEGQKYIEKDMLDLEYYGSLGCKTVEVITNRYLDDRVIKKVVTEIAFDYLPEEEEFYIIDVQPIDGDVNMGYGSIAMKHLIKIAKTMNIKGIYGELTAKDLKAHKSRTLHFYEKFDFVNNLDETKSYGSTRLKLRD